MGGNDVSIFYSFFYRVFFGVVMDNGDVVEVEYFFDF